MRRRYYYGVSLLVLLLCFSSPAQGQNNGRNRSDTPQALPAPADQGRQPDVVLEVPTLKVESIVLEVENLDARLSLDARVANLVALRAGADVGISKVKLEITGVEAEAYLRVDLSNVAAIVNRTLETLENNPEIIEMLGQTLQQTVGTVGDVAGQALGPGGAVTNLTGSVGQTLNNISRPGGLLSQTVNTLGQTVSRTVDEVGNITETTLNQAGQVVGQQALGNVSDLTNIVSETTNTAGQTVRRVRDDAGNLIEYTLGQGNNITNARVVERVRQGTSQN